MPTNYKRSVTSANNKWQKKRRNGFKTIICIFCCSVFYIFKHSFCH